MLKAPESRIRRMVGRTPWSARVPLDPLFAWPIKPFDTQLGRPGAGRGPGGPPYQN